MTKFENGVIISVIVVMIGIFVGILCLMFSHYHEIDNESSIVLTKYHGTTVYTITFYDEYANFLSKTGGDAGMIEDENKKIEYKNKVNLKDIKSKLLANTLSFSKTSVVIDGKEYYVAENNDAVMKLLKSIGKEEIINY